MRMPRSAGAWIGLLAIVVLLGVIVMRVVQGTREGEAAVTVEQERAGRGVPVTVAEVRVDTLELWREYNGTVSGVRDAVVRARSGDQVSSVDVAVGQRVRRGQVLVRQAGAATEARVRQAEAAERQARRSMERLRPLHEAGAISDQDWEGAVTQHELASADLAAARDMVVLTSPLDGVVTEVSVRPGMIPGAGDALLRVADLSALVVTLRMGAAEAAEVREGQPARIQQGTGPDGQVHRIALQADPVSRLVEVEIQFPPTARLIPGTLATVGVRTGARSGALQVPRAAVRDNLVWVVANDGTARRRQVRVGMITSTTAEVLEGLAAGERVVVEGAALLTEGALVRTIETGVRE